MFARKKEKGEKRVLGKQQRILLISALASAGLISAGLLIGDSGVLVNLVVISVFAFILPLFLFRYSEFVWLQALEKEFPNFIRALADATRSGMSFEESVKIVSRSSFGKLTDEVRKMRNRMEWGTSFLRSLEILGERVKRSRLISESLDIIRESHKSGGNVTATLDSIAMNISLFKEIEAERKSMTRQQVMIMYGIFAMFMGVSIITAFVMIPMVQNQAGEVSLTGFPLSSLSDPCERSYSAFPCSLFSSVGVLLGREQGIGTYYISLFFSVVLVLAIFIGLIAGQLGENSVVAGTKHSLVMVTATLAVFLFLAKSGLLPT